MAVKDVAKLNGAEPTMLAPQVMPASGEIALTLAQARHLNRLVTMLGRAQDSAEAAQGNANGFLDYCAEELGVQGWRFDQLKMSFSRPQEE